MTTEKEIKKYIQHPEVIRTYKNYRKIIKKNKSTELNYIGINFDSEGIYSFKFYFAFFTKLTPVEIKKFLPETTDFMKYYHLWEPSNSRSYEHSGCTFEVKFKKDLTPIKGFHYRLKAIKDSYELIGYPENLPYNMLEIHTRPGINYEYSENKFLRKKYYYFNNKEHKKYFAKRFNIPFATRADLIEYTESNAFSKINVWRFDQTEENKNRPNVFNNNALKYINYLKENYGLINISDGYYEKSNIRASYYFNVVNTGASLFDSPQNVNIDTIKLFH
jgi:hypothetical protein